MGLAPRVVYVDHCAEMAGAELALLRTVRSARQTNPYVVLTQDGPLVAHLRDAGVETSVVAAGRDLNSFSRHQVGLNAHTWGVLSEFGRVAIELRKRIVRHLPDVVVSNSMKSHFLVSALRRPSDRWLHVAYVRDRVSRDHMTPSAVALLRALLRARPHGVIANSEATSATVPNTWCRGQERIVIPSPVDLPGSTAAPVTSDGGERTYGIIGRLTPWKGQELAIRAFAHEFRGTPVRLELAGSALFGETDYVEHLKSLTVQLDVSEQVVWLGHVDDIYPLISRWDAVVHASTIPEPFGQVVVQAMAAGRPVLASREGGPREIICDEVDGLLFEPRQVDSLRRQWRRLHESSELRSTLSSAAPAAAARYSTTAVVERIENFLVQLVRRRAGTSATWSAQPAWPEVQGPRGD